MSLTSGIDYRGHSVIPVNAWEVASGCNGVDCLQGDNRLVLFDRSAESTLELING